VDEAEVSASDPFAHAWREVEARWADDAAHRKFIAFCGAQGALAEAGRRYRTVRENDSARAEQAKKWQDAVLAAALQNMQITRVEPEPPAATRYLRWLAFFISGFLIVYGVLVLLRGASQ